MKRNFIIYGLIVAAGVVATVAAVRISSISEPTGVESADNTVQEANSVGNATPSAAQVESNPLPAGNPTVQATRTPPQQSQPSDPVEVPLPERHLTTLDQATAKVIAQETRQQQIEIEVLERTAATTPEQPPQLLTAAEAESVEHDVTALSMRESERGVDPGAEFMPEGNKEQ